MVNFTANTGEVLIMSHRTVILAFINSILVKRNGGNFNVTVWATIDNPNVYTLYAGTSGKCTIHAMTYSRLTFDQTALQSAQLTYIDSGFVGGASTSWASLVLTFPYSFSTNFMAGLTSFAYPGTGVSNFVFTQATLSCTGTMAFDYLEFGYFNYRYRTCPTGYPYFTQITNMCYDVCPSYFYGTAAGLCLPCGLGCYTCSPSNSASCLSCNSTTDFRVLTGTTCPCMPGYYNTGATVCSPCMSTCATCTNATACTSCSAANFRTLTSGQCPCSAGYLSTGSPLCTACSTLITGCSSCTSATVCVACNATAGFVLSSSSCVCNTGYYLSGSSCLSCSASIPGCTACTSFTNCLTCNSTGQFALSGTSCACKTGYYLAASNCVACGVGCLVCTGTAACTSCNVSALFTLSSGVCSCQSGYYASGTSCLPCSMITGCLTCSSASNCLTCNASKQLAAVSGSCSCLTGYYITAGGCSLCSLVLTSCTACTSSSVCTSCLSPTVLSGTTCTCGAAYYLSGSACLLCSSVIVGCSACSDGSTCTTCDAAGNFALSGSSCACNSGYYPSGASCLPCSTGCISCTDTSSCITCNAAAFYVKDNSGLCSCDSANSYVASVGGCQLCSVTLPGCVQCSLTTVCAQCDPLVSGLSLTGNVCSCPTNYTYNATSAACELCLTCCQYFEFLDPTQNLCVPCTTNFLNCVTCNDASCIICSAGSFLGATGECTPCNLPIPGCLSCASSSACSNCDSANHYMASGSVCLCTTGYASDISGSCVPCSSTLPGCLACSSQTTCTNCDASAGFVAIAGNCLCQNGMYLSSPSACSACTMLGCLNCTGLTVCTSCDISLLFVLNGSVCSCMNGYYQSMLDTCELCNLPLVGCTQCADSATCTACDSTQFFELVAPATSCTCMQSYYQSGSLCLPCPTGCTSCDSTGSCLICDAAGGFTSNGTICSCQTGFYQSGTTCSTCSSLFEFCTACTIASCTQCSAPTTVSTGACVCPTGYFNNTVVCQTCSTQFLGCSECILGSCSSCDSSTNFVESGGVCVCQSGYVLIASTCTACSTLMNGCGTCTNPTICNSCDAANNYVMDSGSCVCTAGYFMNSTLGCTSCLSVLDGCATCTSSTVCTACLPSSNYELKSNGTCQCITDYVRSGPNCVSCMVNCVCPGYRRDSNGVCSPFCSDGITIQPTEECDDGNLLAGDGCSPTCKAQPNYTCQVYLNLSTCSYNQPLNMSLGSIVKNPTSNTLTFQISISPNLTDLSQIDFSQIIQTDLPLLNLRFTYSNGVLEMTYDYGTNMHGVNGSFTFNPSYYGSFFATPDTTFQVTVDPSNNLPAIVYNSDTYQQTDTMKKVYDAAVYTSYGLFALGLLCDKVIGVELFGVLQLAYLCVSDLNNVQPLLSPLMNMSIVNGYNPSILSEHFGVPNRIKTIGYKEEFLNNFSLMFGLVLVEIIVALGILAIGSLLPNLRVKSKMISMRMLKEYLLMLAVFNSLNIAYSLGIQTTYGSPDLQVPNIIAGLCALGLPIAMVGVMIFAEKTEFGEFMTHYKRGLICKGYFAVTLLYRLVLGVSLSHQNEVEESTITNVFLGIIFTLYLLANKPYKKAYHNYRAVFCQLTGLTILCVTMYYRSMKSNTPPDVAYRIFSPAILQIVMIFGCIGISAGCLGYELYLKIQERTGKVVSKLEPSPNVSVVRHDTEQAMNYKSNVFESSMAADLTKIYITNEHEPDFEI